MSDLSNTTASQSGAIAILPAPGNECAMQAEGQTAPESHAKPQTIAPTQRDKFYEIFGYQEGFDGSVGSNGPPPPKPDTGTSQAWRLDDEADPFPMDALPPVMRNIVEETALSTMLPRSLAATTALATLAAATGAGFQVNVRGRATRANLFILIGMRSGLGKDDIDRHIIAPLTECDALHRERWEDVIRPGLQEELDEAKLVLASKRKAMARTQDVDEQVQMKDEIRETEKRVRAAEYKLKRCPKLAMTAPGKVQLGLDMMNQDGEACAILTPEGRDSVFRAGDEAFFCKAFSGTREEDSRVTRTAMRLEHPCLTIMLMAQPDFITRQLEREKMVDSGLMPRFLIFVCSPELHEVPIDRLVMPEEYAEAWKDLLWRTVAAFRLRKTDPVVVSASRDVDRLFVDYENENRAKRGTGGDMADIQPFAARWTEQATRIAAVLHVGLHGAGAGNHPLSVETAGHAIRIGRWFVNRQLEALFMQRDAWLRRKAERLREKLVDTKTGAATLGALAKAGWSNDEVRKIAEHCPDLIALERKPAGRQGGRPTDRVRAA